MRVRLLAVTLALIPVTLSGCSDTASTRSASETATAAASSTQAAPPPVVLPVDAMPEVPGGKSSHVDCPYLDSQFAADTNGQRIMGLGIDDRFDPPACVYWSYQEDPMLTVIVRHMDSPADAVKVVDWAAPVDTTNPANEPKGWTGGRMGNKQGAVYAVSKGPVAVVVFSNQAQSLKPQLIAEKVIANLHL